MSQVNTSMNFLPEDYVEKRQAARAAVVFIGLLLLVVGGVVGAYMYSQWQMKGIFETRDRVNNEFEKAAKTIADAQELEKQKEKMVAKAEVTTTLMERVRRSVLLGELTRQRPQGVSFVSMELKTKELQNPVARPNADLDRAARAAQGLPVDAPKPPPVDVTVTLVGTATTDSEVSKYMSNLQGSSLLTQVTLLYSEEFKKNKEDTPVRKFNLEMHINPDADTSQNGTVVEALPKN